MSVLSGVLHPAATPTGRLRQRARLVVVVRIQNRGRQAVTIPRPALLAAGVRTETDPHEDAPGTALGRLGPVTRAQVALQFEVAGTLTKVLAAARRARVVVAGRTLPLPVTTGIPLGPTFGAPAPLSPLRRDLFRP